MATNQQAERPVAECRTGNREEILQLAASAVGHIPQACWQRARRLRHESRECGYFRARRMRAQRAEQIAVELGDAALTAEAIRE